MIDSPPEAPRKEKVQSSVLLDTMDASDAEREAVRAAAEGIARYTDYLNSGNRQGVPYSPHNTGAPVADEAFSDVTCWKRRSALGSAAVALALEMGVEMRTGERRHHIRPAARKKNTEARKAARRERDRTRYLVRKEAYNEARRKRRAQQRRAA